MSHAQQPEYWSHLVELVLQFRSACCSDARDRVYGFRSLARDGGAIPVNYGGDAFDLLVAVVSLYNGECARAHEPASWGGRYWWQGSKKKGNIFTDSHELAQMLAINSAPSMISLSDVQSDWLVVPLRRSDATTERYYDMQGIDPDCGLDSRSIEKSKLDLYEDTLHIISTVPRIILRVLHCGRVVAARIISQWSHELIDWRSHLWMCRYTLAVHISRALFAYCIGFSTLPRDYRPQLRLWSSVSKTSTLARNLDRYRERYRSCGCSTRIANQSASPWSEVMHEECTGRVEIAKCQTPRRTAVRHFLDLNRQQQGSWAQRRWNNGE
jgi:hypothetical protein